MADIHRLNIDIQPSDRCCGFINSCFQLTDRQNLQRTITYQTMGACVICLMPTWFKSRCAWSFPTSEHDNSDEASTRAKQPFSAAKFSAKESPGEDEYVDESNDAGTIAAPTAAAPAPAPAPAPAATAAPVAATTPAPPAAAAAATTTITATPTALTAAEDDNCVDDSTGSDEDAVGPAGGTVGEGDGFDEPHFHQFDAEAGAVVATGSCKVS
jgi:hypothetical protein